MNSWVKALLVLGLVWTTGCDDGGGGSDSVLPDQQTGPNGQSVTVTDPASGAVVNCQPLGSDVWSFNIGYTVEGLDAPGVVQLLVEIDEDATGEGVSGGTRGPYVQGDFDYLRPGSSSGRLNGRLGPPVSTDVRFNLVMQLLDSRGGVVAVSQTIKGLRPAIQ